MFLEIFKNLDDPDSMRGLKPSARASTLAVIYEQNQRWDSALVAHDCALTEMNEDDISFGMAHCLRDQGLFHVLNSFLSSRNTSSAWSRDMRMEAA